MNRFPTFGRTVLRRQFATTPQIPLNPFIKLKDFRVAYPEQIENVFSLSTANQEEITQHKISLAIARFQKHDGDTGSTTVQLAVITEKVYNLARHFAMHKKDKAGQRGFQILLARRRKLMKYLRDTNFEEYRSTVMALGLEKEAIHLQKM